MKRWLKYVLPYKKYFILGPICMLVEVLGEIVMPRLLALALENCDPDTGARSVGLAVLLGVGMVLAALLMMAGGIGGAYFGAKASVNFATDVRRDAYNGIQKFAFANIDRFSSGSLVTRLTNDVTQIQNFVNMLLRMALRAPGIMIGALLSAILAVTVPLTILSVLGVIALGFPRFARMQTKIDALNSTVRENVTNVRVVKSFVREDHETEKFRTANENLKTAGLGAMKIMILLSPVMNILMYATILIIIWSGHKEVLNGDMPYWDLSAFIAYVNQILHSLMGVTMLFMVSSRAMAAGKRICEVLDEKPDLSDLTAAYPEKTVTEGRIEMKNVSFRYFKNSEEEVLSGIDLVIEPGETVGIIGSTGSGKTTLVSLIPRLYDADGGEVLIDGVNVKDYSLSHLRDGISMVLQKNLLFSGSIADNLRWGNENATDEEIREAAVRAEADKFITSFPDGYDTVLEKGGLNISGGQKQRLCIARALLKKPKILILDDSTSAVDTATERRIRSALKDDLSDCTKLIIAQRISSVMEADKIIVMENGRISGVGRHEELLANNRDYREIYQSQTEDRKEA